MATKERQKAQRRKEARAEGNAKASLRKVAISARKARVVAKHLKDRAVGDAMALLQAQQRKAAGPLQKLLRAAVANATERGDDVDALVVESIQVHKGPINRRFMPRAQGRATKIRRQSAHFDIELSVRQ